MRVMILQQTKENEAIEDIEKVKTLLKNEGYTIETLKELGIPPHNVNHGLWLLAKRLEKMAEADAVLFYGWHLIAIFGMWWNGKHVLNMAWRQCATYHFPKQTQVRTRFHVLVAAHPQGEGVFATEFMKMAYVFGHIREI